MNTELINDIKNLRDAWNEKTDEFKLNASQRLLQASLEALSEPVADPAITWVPISAGNQPAFNMTVRQKLSAMALQGILASNSDGTSAEFVKAAWEVADELIAEWERTS